MLHHFLMNRIFSSDFASRRPSVPDAPRLYGIVVYMKTTSFQPQRIGKYFIPGAYGC